MAEINSLLTEITSGLEEALGNCGFAAAAPGGKGTSGSELPVQEQSGRYVLDFSGEGKALRLEYFDSRISLLAAQGEGELGDADFGQLMVSLLDPARADSRDLKSIAAEFSETIEEKFGKKKKKTVDSKLPAPVSKAQARSGAASYDANTLANRLSVMYPELREPYKENIARYGEFLPEEFFRGGGAEPIVATIRQNDPQKMKKLFNLLNEIYEDGTNEIQSIIAVSILGRLENDQELLANCVDYMSGDLLSPVIQVNKFLWSNGGKNARLRMENPPQYKPKKNQKKNGILSALGLQ